MRGAAEARGNNCTGRRLDTARESEQTQMGGVIQNVDTLVSILVLGIQRHQTQMGGILQNVDTLVSVLVLRVRRLLGFPVFVIMFEFTPSVHQ